MHPDIYAENLERDDQEEHLKEMGLSKVTVTTYEYHIYELVDRKWKPFEKYGPPMKTIACRDHCKTHFAYLKKNFSHRIWKFITKKITTTSEFIEE